MNEAQGQAHSPSLFLQRASATEVTEPEAKLVLFDRGLQSVHIFDVALNRALEARDEHPTTLSV